MVLRLLLCVAVVMALLGFKFTGTATDPINTPTSIRTVLPNTTVDPRIGIVDAFRAPSQAATVPIGWERILFWWKELQKDGPNSWDSFATNHDRQINQELSLGRHLAGALINTPDWAAAQPSEHGASPPKGLYLPYNDPNNYWGHFVGEMAKRYAGRIDDWIIWNEVNIPTGTWRTWSGSNADYAQLVMVAYQAAKAANPHARIVLAGDPYWYDHGAFFLDLIHRLTTAPGAQANQAYFDVVNLHLYSRPTEMQPIVDWYRNTMQNAGVVKPIWISETNAIPYDDTVRRYHRGGFLASLDDQASFMIQTFAIDLALDVQRFEVNRMLDGSDFAAGGEPFGLVRNDGTVRPAFSAYRTAATLFAGTTSGTIQHDSHTGVYTVTLQRPGATITVLWDLKPASATVSLPVVSTVQFFDKFGQHPNVSVSGGRATIQLAGATGNTNNANAADYVIGGNPMIVVQPT